MDASGLEVRGLGVQVSSNTEACLITNAFLTPPCHDYARKYIPPNPVPNSISPKT